MYSKAQKAKAKLTPQIASSVTLALTLTNGERLIRDFSPNDSLWDILQCWETESLLLPSLSVSQPDIPLCVYGRKEISSEETLKGTTLLQLGISSGKAAIRYSTRANIPAKQLHVGGILKPVPRPPSPELFIVPTTPETETNEKMEIKIPKSVETTPVLDESMIGTQNSAEHTLDETENIDTLPEELKNNESTQSESILTEETTQQHAVYLNSRGDLIYAMEGPSIDEKKVVEEESEDFFDLSVDELRKMMQDLQRQCSTLQNAPLLTSEQRQAQKELRQRQLLERYPTTILRIQFVDGLVLQVPLPSLMILDDVKKEIISYLEGPITLEDFFLFTSPPKLVLNSSMSLVELELLPSSIVYIGSASNRSCILQHRLRGKISSQLEAMRDATQRLLRIEVIEDTTLKGGRPSVMTWEDNRAKRPAPSNKADVPKWFKIKR